MIFAYPHMKLSYKTQQKCIEVVEKSITSFKRKKIP